VTTYYVSNSGNDSNAGTSEAAPWRTVNKVNNTVFQPGDSILFKSGGRWREKLIPSSPGTSTQPIIYSKYTPGNNPEISGADQWTTWTLVGLDWYSVAGSQSVKPLHVYENNTLMTEVATLAALANGKWFWDAVASPDRLYVRIFSGGDPNTRTIESSARDHAVENITQARVYNRFENLTLEKAQGDNFLSTAPNQTLSAVISRRAFNEGTRSRSPIVGAAGSVPI